LKPTGTVVVDHGAYEAITQKGRSLLPKGLKEVHGKFESGQCIRCVDTNGREFARGLVNYSAAELDKIKGSTPHAKASQ
jgi:glutamate 5-kinase